MDEVSESPAPASRRFAVSNLWDAAPALLIALVYAVTGLGRASILGIDGETMAGFLRVEFIAVLSGTFVLIMIARLKKCRDRMMRIRISATMGFIAAVALGFSFGVGPWGPFLLVMATLGTYWSPWMRWYTDRELGVSLSRGFLFLALYLFWVFLVYHPSEGSQLWHDVRATHLAGLLYFGSLGILEWSGTVGGGNDA